MAQGSRRLIDTIEGTGRVLLVGDRFLILDAMRSALRGEGFDVAVNGMERSALEEASRAFLPDVIIVDVSRAAIDVALRSVRSLTEHSAAVVCITSERISVEAARLVAAGAAGVLGLDAQLPDLLAAVAQALRGRPMPLEHRYQLERLMRNHLASEQRRWLPFDELTERERAIFALVYDGMSAEQIADHECVSVNTVRSHIRNILGKLNVSSQLAAVALARTNRWFDPVSPAI